MSKCGDSAHSLNYCYNAKNSCSSCCGIHNLRLTFAEKQKWLGANTQKFLNTDISQAENIVQYRQEGEKNIAPYVIDQSQYVCPFVGITNTPKKLSGCLLHRDGSPHPQIHLWPHPQNFSFYGESICQNYDCYAKQQQLAGDYFNTLTEEDSLLYAKLISNYNLLQVINLLCEGNSHKRRKLWAIIKPILKEKLHVVSSFETPLNLSAFSKTELWSVIGTILSQEQCPYNPFTISDEGKILGEELELKFY